MINSRHIKTTTAVFTALMLILVFMLISCDNTGDNDISTDNISTDNISTDNVNTDNTNTDNTNTDNISTDDASGNNDIETDDDRAAYEFPLAAGVTAEMLDVSFWTNASSDKEIMMTADEIEIFNRSVYDEMSDKDTVRVSTEDEIFDITSFASVISGSVVNDIIMSLPLPDTASYMNGSSIKTSAIDSIAKNRNVNAIDDEITLRYGVITKRANARLQPTDDFFTDDKEDLFYDNMQQAELNICDAVLILHTSFDENWFFIMSAQFCGWVQVENVAEFASRDAWLTWINPDRFLIVTASSVRLEEDPYSSALSGAELMMGTKLRLVDEGESMHKIGKRAAYMNYIIELPTRNKDGMFKSEMALLSCRADVSVGYPAYTRAAVLEQAFKLLGKRYGWGGLYNSTDCSGLVSQVYKCFGIILPRNSSSQAKINSVSYNLAGMNEQEKKELFDSLLCGSLLYFPGHIMIYLGKHEGNYYVISSVGGMVPEDSETGVVEDISGIIINTLDVRRRNLSTWYENLTAVKVIINK